MFPLMKKVRLSLMQLYLETAGFAVFVGYDDYPLNEDDDEDKSYISANAQYVSDTEKITAVGSIEV